MGNGSTSSSEPDIDLVHEYKQLRRQQHGVVLLQRLTKTTFLLKEFAYGLDRQIEQAKKRFQREIQHGQCDNILSVVKFKQVTVSGLCSTSHKIYAIYEYPQVTLQDEIQARQKEGKRFDEHELWSILQSCNLALPLLKPTLSLNASQVFITSDGEIKIIHNDMVDENYRFAVNPLYHYAPEKITNFNRNDSEEGLSKEAVFSLGMTMLEAATLDTISHCYDYTQHIFLDMNLEALLSSLSPTYSQEFIHIVSQMLEIDVSARCSFADIQKQLDISYKSQSNENCSSSDFSSVERPHDAKTGHRQSVSQISQASSGKRGRDTKRSNKQVGKTDSNIISLRPSQRTQRHKKAGAKVVAQKQKTANNPEPQLISQPCSSSPYTDPNLLAMIRKDLDDMSKLKQSYQQQIKKYTFLYPGVDSVYSSIKESTQDAQGGIQTRVLTDKNTNFQPDIKEFSKVDTSVRQSKEIVEQQIQMQMKQLKKSVENVTYTRFKDEHGRRYEGYVINGKKQGKGKLTFPDGAFYKGQFKDDFMSGQGTLYYNTRQPAYEGMWEKDQFHGHGILYNENPVLLFEPFNFRDFEEVDEYWVKYEGEFSYDQKCGMGRLFLTNGEQIEAMFQNDNIHGQGRFIDKQGHQTTGIWEMNRLVLTNES